MTHKYRKSNIQPHCSDVPVHTVRSLHSRDTYSIGRIILTFRYFLFSKSISVALLSSTVLVGVGWNFTMDHNQSWLITTNHDWSQLIVNIINHNKLRWSISISLVHLDSGLLNKVERCFKNYLFWSWLCHCEEITVLLLQHSVLGLVSNLQVTCLWTCLWKVDQPHANSIQKD